MYLQSKTETYWENLETFVSNQHKRIYETEILVRFLDSAEAWIAQVNQKFGQGHFEEEHQIQVHM